MHFRIFNRSSSGTVTFLFFGNAITRDISAGTTPALYEVNYARRNATTFFVGDRLGVQVNVSTDNAASRTVSLDVAGNTNATMVSNAYWQCDDETGSSDSGGGDGTGIMFGVIGGLIGGLILIRRRLS
jgi:hypothetical protein